MAGLGKKTVQEYIDIKILKLPRQMTKKLLCALMIFNFIMVWPISFSDRLMKTATGLKTGSDRRVEVTKIGGKPVQKDLLEQNKTFSL